MDLILKYRSVFFIFLFLNFPKNTFSQDKNLIDSLANVLKITKEDTQKVALLIRLSDETRKGNPREAISIGKQAIELSEKLMFQKGRAEALFLQGNNFYYISSFDSALFFINQALNLSENNNYRNIKASALNLIGQINYYHGKYEDALGCFLKSLNTRDTVADQEGTAITLNSIGLVHYAQGDYSRAKEYYFQALSIREKINEKQGMAQSLNSLGNATFGEQNYEKAKEYYQRAYNIALEIKDKSSMAYCLGNLGGVYGYQKNFGKAIECFLEVLKLQQELGDEIGISSALNNIGFTYAVENKFPQAIGHFLKSLKIAEKLKSKELMKYNYEGLAEVYFEMKDYKNAFEYRKLFSNIKDSMLNEENSKQLVEMQTKYETEKKDAEIQLLNKNKEIQTVEIKRQKIYVYSVIVVLTLVITLSFFIYRSNKQKQLANLLLEKRNSEIIQSKLEIENKNNALESVNVEITKKKKEIEEKNEEVLSSIRYAKRIQQAVLKAEKKVTPYLPEHFVLFKPKDIVSGDFYWTMEKKLTVESCSIQSTAPGHQLPTFSSNIWYVAAADCTGHGVPGAFLTMLGMSFLNEITATGKYIHPSEILDELRNRIIKELGQIENRESRDNALPRLLHETKTKSETTVQDGMDISLISLNLQTLELEWSGANNPMYVIAKNEDTRQMLASTGARSHADNNLALFEIRADKQPIGYFPEPKPFTNHKIQLKKNDSVFIFSDGYADQFGGPKGKKFKYSQFEKLILFANERHMEDQKNLLKNELEKWMGNHEQIDDICIIGMRV